MLVHHQATTLALGQLSALCSGKEGCPSGPGESESGEGQDSGGSRHLAYNIHDCACSAEPAIRSHRIGSFSLLTRTRQKGRVSQGPHIWGLSAALPVGRYLSSLFPMKGSRQGGGKQ